jgi:hypothetical protein
MCLASLTIDSIGASPSQVKWEKGETSPTFMDDYLDFTGAILMGLDSMDADLNRPDDVMNPFNLTCDGLHQWNLLVSRIPIA